jgi:hypothetical protein
MMGKACPNVAGECCQVLCYPGMIHVTENRAQITVLNLYPFRISDRRRPQFMGMNKEEQVTTAGARGERVRKLSQMSEFVSCFVCLLPINSHSISQWHILPSCSVRM